MPNRFCCHARLVIASRSCEAISYPIRDCFAAFAMTKEIFHFGRTKQKVWTRSMRTRPLGSVRQNSASLFRFFDRNNFRAIIVTAVRADPVRNIHIVAVGTFREILRLECEMTAAAVTASFREFSFW